jgi:hypothetical protein
MLKLDIHVFYPAFATGDHCVVEVFVCYNDGIAQQAMVFLVNLTAIIIDRINSTSLIGAVNHIILLS